MDSERVNQSMHEKLPRLGVVLAAASLAVSGAVMHYDRSGTVEATPAVQSSAQPMPESVIISGNAHNELPKRINMLKKVIEQQNPSVLMMQEVSADSQDDLARAFPDQNMAFVFGDARQKARQGGLGNIIMSKNALENIKSRKIEKITPMDSYIKGAKGLLEDLVVFDFSFTRLDRALVEDRAIIAATTEVIVGDKVEKVQVATSHIDRGDGVRQPQLETVTEFLSDIADDADSTVFCGDLNTNSHETITAFAKIGFAVIPTPHKTYIGGQKGSTVDHCAYDASGRVGYKRTTIVDEFQTDHRGIEIALKRLPGVK